MDFLQAFEQAKQHGVTKEEFLKIWETELNINIKAEEARRANNFREQFNSQHPASPGFNHSNNIDSRADGFLQQFLQQTRQDREELKTQLEIKFHMLLNQLAERQDQQFIALQNRQDATRHELGQRFEMLSSHMTNAVDSQISALKLYFIQEMDLLKRDLGAIIQGNDGGRDPKVGVSEMSKSMPSQGRPSGSAGQTGLTSRDVSNHPQPPSIEIKPALPMKSLQQLKQLQEQKVLQQQQQQQLVTSVTVQQQQNIHHPQHQQQEAPKQPSQTGMQGSVPLVTLLQGMAANPQPSAIQINPTGNLTNISQPHMPNHQQYQAGSHLQGGVQHTQHQTHQDSLNSVAGPQQMKQAPGKPSKTLSQSRSTSHESLNSASSGKPSQGSASSGKKSQQSSGSAKKKVAKNVTPNLPAVPGVSYASMAAKSSSGGRVLPDTTNNMSLVPYSSNQAVSVPGTGFYAQMISQMKRREQSPTNSTSSRASSQSSTTTHFSLPVKGGKLGKRSSASSDVSGLGTQAAIRFLPVLEAAFSIDNCGIFVASQMPLLTQFYHTASKACKIRLRLFFDHGKKLNVQLLVYNGDVQDSRRWPIQVSGKGFIYRARAGIDGPSLLWQFESVTCRKPEANLASAINATVCLKTKRATHSTVTYETLNTKGYGADDCYQFCWDLDVQEKDI